MNGVASAMFCCGNDPLGHSVRNIQLKKLLREEHSAAGTQQDVWEASNCPCGWDTYHRKSCLGKQIKSLPTRWSDFCNRKSHSALADVPGPKYGGLFLSAGDPPLPQKMLQGQTCMMSGLHNRRDYIY